MTKQTLDLGEPSAPDGIPDVLRAAAMQMREQASELQSSWQDKGAGQPWNMIADELERAATRITSKLD